MALVKDADFFIGLNTCSLLSALAKELFEFILIVFLFIEPLLEERIDPPN